jgi:hypothetical protein
MDDDDASQTDNRGCAARRDHRAVENNPELSRLADEFGQLAGNRLLVMGGAGLPGDEFAGTNNLDKLWVLSDLIRSDELGGPSRLRVLALRLKALAHSSKAIVDTPRSERVKQVIGSAVSVWYVAREQWLRLNGRADG